MKFIAVLFFIALFCILGIVFYWITLLVHWTIPAFLLALLVFGLCGSIMDKN